MTLDRKDYKSAIPQLEKRLKAVEGDTNKGLASFDVLKAALEAEKLARQKAVLKVDDSIDLVTVKMFYALVDPDDYVGGLPPASTTWSQTMPNISAADEGLVLWYKSKTYRNDVEVNESAPQTIQILNGVYSFVNTVAGDNGWTTIDGDSITTGKIQAAQGDSFFNLDDGTFKVYSSVTGQGIIWNGSNLTINGSITLTGHSDSVADEISALQVSADGSLLYDHTYAWNNAKTEVTFTAHVYRGGEDVTSEFSDEDFTWYYKTEANLEEQPLTNTNNNPTNCGKTITIPTTGASPKVLLSAIGYGAEIVGKFTPPSNNRNLLRSNGDTYTDVNNRALQTRAGSGTEVRVRDLEYTTTLSTSNALMVVTSETEKLATIETLVDTLKSSTTPIVDGTATVGNEKKFASGNHVHPTDTSRAAAVHTHTTSDVTDFPSLATVATSGDYTDLDNTPSLATVATSGSYNDLLNTPTIPTVNNATLTIQKNGTTVNTFTANASSDVTANITVPTQASDIGAQATLVSGTNIKTINNTSLLGSGNIDVSGGGGGGMVDDVEVDGVSVVSDRVASIDLTGKADAVHTHTTSDVTDFPSLATVATSGDYDDLTDKPSIHNVPSGGTSGQMLTKSSGTDYDVGWTTPPDISGKIDTAGTGLSKSSTTLNHSNSITAQTTQGLYPIKIDAQGHISSYGSAVTIPDVSGKIDTAGTGLSKSGTTLNHSNSITAQTTQGLYPIEIDAQGHITAYGSAQTIPTVNNATLTIQKNGSSVATFTANASSNVTANITVPTTAGDVSAVALADKYTRSSAGDLAWTNQTDGDAKVIAKSALAFWNGAYSGNNSNLSKCSTGSIVGTNGATMTGQLKTSFKTSVAMGSYGSSQTTVDGLAGEIRYSSGASGSASIGTAYTKSGVTIATGWYNFFYMPHRSGGNSGSADGDNANYGNLFLFGMNNTNGRFIVRVSSGSITEVARLVTSVECKDYVTETGTSGKWSYTKWASKKIELWANDTATVSCTSAFASTGAYYSGAQTYNLPTNLSLASITQYFGSGAPANQGWIMVVSASTTSLSWRAYNRTSNSSCAVDLNFYVVGTYS